MSQCPICLENVQNALTLECQHTFCGMCLLNAAWRGHNSCPICRAPCVEEPKQDVRAWFESEREREREDVREELREEQRLFRRGVRLARDSKASPELQRAVDNYHQAVSTRKALEQEKRDLSRGARQHARDIRDAVAQLRRGAPRLVEWVDVRVEMKHYTMRYWSAFSTQVQARRAVVAAAICEVMTNRVDNSSLRPRDNLGTVSTA